MQLIETAAEVHNVLLTLNEAERYCLSNSELSKFDMTNLSKNVAKGKDAEIEIFQYQNYLIACNNPVCRDEWVKSLTDAFWKRF